jgi:hypothetical protein
MVSNSPYFLNTYYYYDHALMNRKRAPQKREGSRRQGRKLNEPFIYEVNVCMNNE